TFHMGIVVDRACLDLVQGFDIPRPEIHSVERADGEADEKSSMTVKQGAGRSRKQVHTETDGIAKIRRAEEQQYEIGSVAESPGVQRLTEIARLLRQPAFACRVEQTRDPQG